MLFIRRPARPRNLGTKIRLHRLRWRWRFADDVRCIFVVNFSARCRECNAHSECNPARGFRVLNSVVVQHASSPFVENGKNRRSGERILIAMVPPNLPAQPSTLLPLSGNALPLTAFTGAGRNQTAPARLAARHHHGHGLALLKAAVSWTISIKNSYLIYSEVAVIGGWLMRAVNVAQNLQCFYG